MGSLFQAGADACFAEDVSEAMLLKSIELLMLGGAPIPATIPSEPPKDPGAANTRVGAPLNMGKRG
jgi:hypothetical protein